jgi:hypothetical protein
MRAVPRACPQAEGHIHLHPTLERQRPRDLLQRQDRRAGALALGAESAREWSFSLAQ